MSRASRRLAAECAARVHESTAATGTQILSTMILFEAWLEEGGDAAAKKLGWDIAERAPVSLKDIKAQMKREDPV